jgi:hypothetical protein
MSRIINDSFAPGDAVTAARLNQKFTDIVTATTAALDEENFAPESIDYQQLAVVSGSGVSDIVLRTWKLQGNGLFKTGGTAYTSEVAGSGAHEVSHASGTRVTWASGTPLAPSDVIRVHWSLFVEEFTTYTNALFSGSLGETPQPVWLCWLEWDITSASLGNWVPVDGQTDFEDDYTLDREGGNTDDAQATMVIPHGFISRDGVVYINRQRPYAQHHRSWCYKRGENQSTLTIYGIRMVIAGLYHPVYAARTGTKNSFERETNPDWSDEVITISQARLGALIMRGN